MGMVFRSTFTAQGSGDDRQQQRNLLKVSVFEFEYDCGNQTLHSTRFRTALHHAWRFSLINVKVAFLTYGTGFALWLIEQAMCDHVRARNVKLGFGIFKLLL